MLTQLRIRNLITIHEVNLEFGIGTTVITGETGVGKSILIDAIELGLGERANGDVVRPGQEKAEISLSFDVSDCPQAVAWLKNYDLDNEAGECIIRRSINKDGRSRSYINGMPTTLQPLRELSELLMSIHGQHQHQALLKPDIQRDLLDKYAGHIKLVDNVRALAEEWYALSRDIKELQSLAIEHKQRGEFLKYQLQELEELNLTPDEFQILDQEHKQLAHSDELLQNLNHALQQLSDNENNASQCLHRALHALETVQAVDPKISNWIESLKNAIVHVSDTEDELRRYLDHVEIDPDRLYNVENRISLLFDLARKHKVGPHELFDLQKKLSTEYARLENSDEQLSEMRQKLDALEKHYHEVAHKLSQSRLKAAKKLADEITATIKELALPHGEFHILFEMEDFSHPSPLGTERVIFEIKTNPGQSLQPLARVISGGELSRISLAIHLATGGKHTISSLIFDEVDVGIGGATAEIVGKLLRRLGTTHQVICITHAPQVAAQSHHHFRVEKYMEHDLTYTRIQPLSLSEKIQELARMLGGVEITQKTLEHAREMVENVDNPADFSGDLAAQS